MLKSVVNLIINLIGPSYLFRKWHKFWQDKRKKEFQRNYELCSGKRPYLPDPVNGGNNVSTYQFTTHKLFVW